MLGSYRGIVAALVGWLILSAATVEDSKTGGDQAASERATGDHLKRIATALEKPPPSSQPDPGCDKGKEERSSDLCAQWKAADAASDAAWWAGSTFWLGIAGVAVGAFTLASAAFAAWYAKAAAAHTKDNVIEAKRAAQAAEDTLAETRRVHAIQLRPYIAFAPPDNPRTEEPISFMRLRSHPMIINIRNFGQTPGRNVILHHGFDVFKRPFGHAEPEFFELQSLENIPPHGYLPVSVNFDGVTDAELHSIEAGDLALIQRFRVEYQFDGGSDFDELTMFLVKEHFGKRLTGHTLTKQMRAEL